MREREREWLLGALTCLVNSVADEHELAEIQAAQDGRSSARREPRVKRVDVHADVKWQERIAERNGENKVTRLKNCETRAALDSLDRQIVERLLNHLFDAQTLNVRHAE